MSVLYGARTADDVLFGADLAAWASDAGVQVGVTVDRASTAWTGRVGLVTELVSRATFDPARTLALVCGPEVMMRYVAGGAHRDVACRRNGSGCPWSGTCAAAWVCAGTASCAST